MRYGGLNAFGLRSVQTGFEDLSNQFRGEAAYIVVGGTEYAIYVEMGTRYMAAQPALRPAIQNARRELPVIAARAQDIDQVVELLASRIADLYRGSVPVDTGRLRDSIEYRRA